MGCSWIAPIQRQIGKVVDVAQDVVEVVAPVAAVIPGPWQVPAQIYMVAKAVDEGGIEQALPAILSIAVGQVVPTGSVTGSIAADAAIKSGVIAAATGGDPVKAALTAAVASGLSEGSDTYSPAQPAAVDNIFSDSTSGDFSAVPTDTSSFFDAPTGVVVGDPISPGYSMDSVVSLPPLDIPVPYVEPPTPYVEPPVSGLDQYAFEPSYSLAPDVPTVNEGFQAPPLDTAVWDGSSPVDYSLPTAFSEGLQILPSPSLPSMGGGQGLTTPVEGGTVGSLGFTPTGASPILGDPASFINNPEITGQPVMATEAPPGMTAQQQSDLLKQVIKSFGSAGLMGSAMSYPQQGQQPAYQPASTMPNYSPEYFQQVQQKYNQIAPAMPADVATPLSEWYNKTPYQPSIVSKLFGVI
jgi:hypothetical protein